MKKQKQAAVPRNKNAACLPQGNSEIEPANRPAWMRRVARTMLLVLLSESILPAVTVHAQTPLPIAPSASAPAGQRPIIDAANNGVPIVHIAPPSAAGVSRNQYEQFNVNPNGLILNNSTQHVQTELGGWITNNMQLAPAPARIVLNEVVSANPSQLRGTIEIAGQRADIVVANPNGITCDGCGFLNTGRTSMVAGKPQFGSSGDLSGFDVRQGRLNVGGNGLNAANLEQLDLIARGIVIEGEVWAQNLNVIAGTNQVLYGTLQAAVQAGGGTAPRFAIDIKDLGGMYANQIILTATESGLGVNSTGRIAALQGNLALSADGDLSLQQVYAKQGMRIGSGGNVALSGETRSDGSITIAAAGALRNAGEVDSQAGLVIAAGSIDNEGTIVQRNADGATLNAAGRISNSGVAYSGGALRLAGQQIDDRNGILLSSGSLVLQASDIALSGTRIATDAEATLAAGGTLSAQRTEIDTAGDLMVSAKSVIDSADSVWQTMRSASMQADTVTNRRGSVLADEKLTIHAGEVLGNDGGALLAGGDIRIEAGTITSNAGRIAATGNIGIQGDSLGNAGGSIASGTDVELVLKDGALSNNAGTVEAGRALTVNAGAVDNRNGHMLAGSLVSVQAASVDTEEGLISAGDTVGIESAGAVRNASGAIIADRDVGIAAATLDNTDGTVSAGEIATVRLGAGLLDNRRGFLSGSGTLAVQSGEIRNAAGTIASGSALALDTQGRLLSNTQGTIVARGALHIDSNRLENADGIIASVAGELDIDTHGQELDSKGGKLQAADNVTLAAGKFSNEIGLVAGLHITADTADFDNRSGQIMAGGDLDIASMALNNEAGLLQAIGSLNVDTGGQSFVNANSGVGGGVIAGGELNITAGSLDNRQGFIGSNGSQAIRVSGDIDNRAGEGAAGQIVANADITLGAANVLNAGGRINTLGDLGVSATTLDNRGGQLLAGGGTALAVSMLDNSEQGTTGGTIDSDTLSITASLVKNHGGALRAARDATIETAAFDNTSGAVSAKALLSMQAGSLANAGGSLVGDGGVTITTGSESPGGTIASANDVTLNVTGGYRNSGLLSAQRNLIVNASSIANSGTLAAGDVLTANTGSLANFGTIKGNTTRLNVSGTLTNAGTGLIDGVNTYINAATTDNSGRIYGDVLKINGVTVNNTGSGVIAARNALAIGAQYVNNTGGALMYSLGNMAIAGGLNAAGTPVGQTAQLLNASSRIEAAGNIAMSVDNLVNRNDALSTRTVTMSEAINKTYIQPNGAVEKYDVNVLGWDGGYKRGSGRYVLPSSVYPIVEFGSVAKKLARETVWSWGGEEKYRITKSNYLSSDPVWALFGVAPPYTGDLVEPVYPTRAGGCMTSWDGIDYRVEYGVCGDYWKMLDSYNATVAKRIEDAENALNAKISAFNTDVVARAFEAWNEYQYTNQIISETVIDSTAPAQILAGGAIQIAGSGMKLNDNSQIVAGGAIDIGGSSMVNQAAQGTRSVTEEGRVRFRRIEHHGGLKSRYEIELYPWYATTGAPYVETFQLPGYSYVAYGGNQTAARNLISQTAAPSGATSMAVSRAVSHARAIGTATVAASMPANTGAHAPPSIQKFDVPGAGTQPGAIILSTLPELSAPTSNLFTLLREPAARHLVETDPSFTDYRTFLSSDYFLQALDRDPERQLKRYGDGFYEQKMVNDQILALTGRRYLSGYSDTQSEYQSLMDAGVAFAKQYQLTPGVALSAEQMALLTTDIVWLTTQSVTMADGSTEEVLVPQVYLRRPQDGDLQPSGALIAGSDIRIVTDEDIVNSGTIAADRTATLNAGRDLINEGGRISGKGILAAADNDLKNLSGIIAGNGDASSVKLLAGRDMVLQTRTIGSSTATSSRVSVDRIATVQGGNIRMAAGRDLTAEGSMVSAKQDLVATAGRDIRIASVAGSYQLDVQTGGSTKGRTGYIREESTTNQIAAFNAAGNLAVAAANDVRIQGGDLSAGNELLLQGASVAIEAARDRQLVDVQNVRRRAYDRTLRDDEALAGGNVTAGSNLTVIANGTEAGSGNIAVRGAYLSSQSGQLAAIASGDITIDALATEHRAIDESYSKSRRTLAKVTKERSSTTTIREAQGSVITGNTVVMNAQGVGEHAGNLTIAGSSVVADGDIALGAANDVTLAAVAQTYDNRSFQQTRKSGMFASGGASVTLGKQQTDQLQVTREVTHAGATVASLEGNVAIDAGRQYAQTGSQLLAQQGDIDIAAQRIDIAAAIDTRDNEQQTRFRQSGLTVAASAPVLDALQAVQRTGEAATKTDDKRMQALAAATAVAQLVDSAKAMAALAEKAGNPTVVNISLTVGSASSDNKQTQSSTSVVGSAVAAGGSLALRATGDGKDSNITVIGSNLRSGGDATQQADGAIDLRAAQNTYEQHSQSKSASGGVGVAIAVNRDGGAAAGFTAQASAARGSADGRDVTQVNTHVDAGNTLTLLSGSDTNLKGAVVSGRRINATVGGNLNIESLQDTSVYDSKDLSASGSVTIGYGFSGSASASRTKINADFASVTEQSGIRAGDGGFQIDVAGNTDLKGGAIASSEQAVIDDKNRLSTATLTHSDIENRSQFSASSIGLAGGFSVSSNDAKTQDGKGGNAKQDQPFMKFGNGKNTSAGFGSASGSDSNTTQSGISGGALIVTGGQQELTVSRDVVAGGDGGGVAKNWNVQGLKDEVTAQAQITQASSQQARKAVEDYVEKNRTTLLEQMKHAANDEDRVKLREQLDDLALQERVMNVLIGAVTGLGTTAVTKEALSAAADQMRQEMVKDSMIFKGVVDPASGDPSSLTNLSGESEGMRGDGVKLGGTRLDLDKLCGINNERCVVLKDSKNEPIRDANGKTQLALNEKDQVQWDAKSAGMTLSEFLNTDKGKDLAGATGGIQGASGTLFGRPYEAGGWEDKLIEAFAGTHDLIGGKLSDLYDEQGNAKRGRSKDVQILQEVWSGVAIVPSTPFAMAELLPPEVWNAISILLKAP